MATQAEIQAIYDATGTDFYRLWLDERMVYSCALWEPGDTLERAQTRKLAFIHDLARLEPEQRVLDVGCGWGAGLEYLCRERGVRRAHGITLSDDQAAEVERRAIPGASVDVVDYRDFEPDQPFDAVVSVGMFEHVLTPEQAAEGLQVDVYRDYFARVHRWTRPGAWFALQTCLLGRVPRNRRDAEDIVLASRNVFPGGHCGRLEDVIRAIGGRWELMEVLNRREHYVRTCEAWLERMHANEAQIRERFGDELFEEYVHGTATWAHAFRRRYGYVAQFALRRIDETRGNRSKGEHRDGGVP